MRDEALTGYPSIDKPWLKYYTEEQMQSERNCSIPWRNTRPLIGNTKAPASIGHLQSQSII